MAAKPDAAATLNELEAFLRQPDAVLEPTIVERLKEYVMCHGQPQQAVEYLTDGHQGYAQMAVLMCQWLASATAAGEERSPEAAGPTTLDEADCLRALIEDRFDPGKFNSIFARGGSGAPSWLNGLLSDADGRRLIYSLSARFSNSLLLNFAIQKILQQPGREAEVAALAPRLGSYFGVFHRLMASRLAATLATDNEHELQKLSQEIQHNAAQSQHTYLYVQALLRYLAQSSVGRSGSGPDCGGRFRRLAAELEDKAASSHGPQVRRLARLFPLVGDGLEERAATDPQGSVLELVSDLINTPAAAQPSLDVVTKLHHVIVHSGEALLPCYLSVLRQPHVVDALLRALFGPGPPLGASATFALTSLLALTAAGGGQEQHDRVEATKSALEESAVLCRAAFQEGRLQMTNTGTPETLLSFPICAAGLLTGMTLRLTRTAYWSTTIHTVHAPPFLSLLRIIIVCQPALQDHVLLFIRQTLEALGNSNHDIARGLLDCVVALLETGHVLPVLHWADGWAAGGADPSLLRHLVFAILEVAAPPYSSAFAAAVLRLMMRAGVKPSSSMAGSLAPTEAARQALLEEFGSACGTLNFRPPLLAREAKFLQALCDSTKEG